MTDIPKGFGIIAGRGRENALKALAAAEAAGLEPTVVQTVAEGYLVPDAVIKKFHAAAKAEEAEPKAPAKKAAAKKPAEAPTQETGPEAEAETEEG